MLSRSNHFDFYFPPRIRQLRHDDDAQRGLSCSKHLVTCTLMSFNELDRGQKRSGFDQLRSGVTRRVELMQDVDPCKAALLVSIGRDDALDRLANLATDEQQPTGSGHLDVLAVATDGRRSQW